MQASALPEQPLTKDEKRRLVLCACAGFFLSPGAWLLQVMISETISAQACYAESIRRAKPVFTHFHAWLYGTSAAAVLVSVVCAGLAVYGFRFLQKKEKQVKEASESSSEKPSRLEEQLSRKRFIALCSALIGCLFVLALVFTILAEVFLGSCNPWH
ncbi:conserved membrane hypothetical protein [Burkholderia sp. 8Y]|uniref:hypothetical protein n=1 Tax=Burkholderia sp. 8Y TaxID=2653133 RepID=UPI0012EF677C|nr:hypothetical protein [Burkholderia sp. 8Y]VXC67264.1 conserved membrane hypothetical protein [Burkholderia sp. 8Y]